MSQYGQEQSVFFENIDKADISEKSKDSIKQQFTDKEDVVISNYDPVDPPQNADVVIVGEGVEVAGDPGGSLVIFQGAATGNFVAFDGRVIVANALDDEGKAVNNTINLTGTGSATVETGDGFDVVNVADFLRIDANFELDESGNLIVIGPGYTLTGVEVVQFEDGMSVITENEDQAIVARMYQILFDREPDEAGLEYWFDTLQGASFEDGTHDMWDVTHAFMVSEEYEEKYADMSDQEFLTELYTGMTGRDPDMDGFAYWLDVLENPENYITNWKGEDDNAKVHVAYAFAYSDEAEQAMGLDGTKYIIPVYDMDE